MRLQAAARQATPTATNTRWLLFLWLSTTGTTHVTMNEQEWRRADSSGFCGSVLLVLLQDACTRSEINNQLWHNASLPLAILSFDLWECSTFIIKQASNSWTLRIDVAYVTIGWLLWSKARRVASKANRRNDMCLRKCTWIWACSCCWLFWVVVVLDWR